MKCPYCGNEDEELIEKTPLSPTITTSNSTHPVWVGHGTEYFCNCCGEYYSWRQKSGLSMTTSMEVK
jgi:hypothetical protein